MPDEDEQEVEITWQEIRNYLPDETDLIYIDYDENLDEQLDLIQECINKQDWMPLDEKVFEWFLESRDNGVDYEINRLKEHMMDDYDDEDAIDAAIEEYSDSIREALEECDQSNPLHDLLHNTTDPVCYYETGLEIPYESDDSDGDFRLIKETLQIKDDKYDRQILSMMANANYGGLLVVFFRMTNIEDWIILDKMDTVVFENPMVAIVDRYNGSGDHEALPGHVCEFPIDPSRIVLDKVASYSYTYQTCGMYDDWCNCTDVKLAEKQIRNMLQGAIEAFNNLMAKAGL